MRILVVLLMTACASASVETSATKPARKEPSPPPPYDLAADRARIADVARTELGTATIDTAQDVFVLVGAPGWDAKSLAASTDLTTRALDAYYSGRFDTRPTRAIGVYLFADKASYQSYCKQHLGRACDSPFGVYHPEVRRIVMNAGPGLGTLTHELVHPIVEADFPKAPIWINEGIASLFEAPTLGPKRGEIHGMKNWRLPRLLSGMRSRDERYHARLDSLFGMTDEAFRGPLEKLHYATARYVCQWLDARGWLWPFYHAWRDGYDTDRTGAKAFERITGMSPALATTTWTAWVHAL
jgi:hypothetical protein